MSSTARDLVRLSMELALSVNEYNSHSTHNVDEIVSLTLLYLSTLKKAVEEKVVHEDEVAEYYAVVGKVWAAVDASVHSG
jgi:hypothetical protein